MGRKLTYNEMDLVLKELQKDFVVFAPKRFLGKGRFSDTDLVNYAVINSFSEIEWKEKSVYSPKDIVFPINQTAFLFEKGEIHEPENFPEKDILIFLRTCDINGFDRLDGIFLNNGPYEDIYYQSARKKIKFALIECNVSYENCFCVSMNANVTDDHVFAVKFSDTNAYVSVKDLAYNRYFESAGKKFDYKPEFITVNETSVKLPDMKKISPEIFENPLWEEYDKRCIACGICNTSCVTCSCFTSKDISHSGNDSFERMRVWAGCHIDHFTDMAGGHSFRGKYGSRMRYKVMHKINDYKKRFGKHMCVGCGRCDDNCPEYISFSNSINKLNDLLEGEK
jgi:anaerobic sulfite reductase subunit A